MNRFGITALATLLVAATLPAVANAAPTTRTIHIRSSSTARAKVDIDPFSTIKADVRILDDGTTDIVTGYGTGFTPGLAYISFFYGTGSVPRGTLACLPPAVNTLTAPQMVVGYWMGTGSQRTLSAVKTSNAGDPFPYAPLGSVDTMSVRYDSQFTTLGPYNNSQAITPARFWLNSCGDLRF